MNMRTLLAAGIALALLSASFGQSEDDRSVRRERTRDRGARGEGAEGARSRQPPNPATKEFLDAVTAGDLDKVKSMLAADATLARSMNRPKQSALQLSPTAEIATAILDADVNINNWDIFGVTALCEAVGENRKEVVAVLLERGADTEIAEDKSRFTPLHRASLLGHKEIVEMLLAKGAKIEARDVDGRTPLLVAYNRPQIAEVLLAHGAELNATDKNRLTALDYAVNGDRKESIEFFKSRGAVGTTTLEELVGAAMRGDLETIRRTVPSAPNLIDRHSPKSGENMLTGAASRGRREIVEFLIKAGARLDLGNTAGVTALHWAARLGDVELAKLLLDAGATPDQGYEANKKRTALHEAAAEANAALVGLLIARGANIEARDANERTPLHSAASAREPRVITALLAAGAKADVLNDDGNTPLITAFSHSKWTQVQALLDAKAGVNIPRRDGWTALHFVIRNGGDLLAWVPALLASGAEPNAKDATNAAPLHYAVFYGSIEAAEALVAAGADVNAKGGEILGTPLHVAAVNAPRIVEWLLAHGADVNAVTGTGDPVLHTAIANQDLESAKLLLDSGARPDAVNNAGDAALHFAAFTNNTDLAVMLLGAGADINLRNPRNGGTPLLFAADGEATESATFLIEKGADIEAKTADGKTPLLVAAEKTSPEIGLLLLEKGANAKAATSSGATVLHSAVLPVAKAAVARGADVNARMREDVTPLHLQSYYGRLEVVQLLLDNKAKAKAADAKGWTALDYAELEWRDREGNSLETEETLAAKPKIAELLRQRGVKSGKKPGE